MVDSQIDVIGNLLIEVFAADGALLQSQRIKNKVPQTGRNVVRQLLLRPTVTSAEGIAPTHMAVGTGSTAAADGDTVLDTELTGGRYVILNRYAKANAASYQIYIATGELNGNTLREAGLFDSSTKDAGNMLARAVFSPIVKTVSVEVVLTWDINIAST
jgi:hypothetical protein